jgi:hypothetical protein
MTPDDVVGFLVKLKLPQYSDAFKSEEISSDVLLAILSADNLRELGVTSPLHQMKIMQLFPREVYGTQPKYSNGYLCQILGQLENHAKYIPILKEHNIDGDMILNVEVKLMKSVLKEIGINNPIALQAIQKLFRK